MSVTKANRLINEVLQYTSRQAGSKCGAAMHNMF